MYHRRPGILRITAYDPRVNNARRVSPPPLKKRSMMNRLRILKWRYYNKMNNKTINKKLGKLPEHPLSFLQWLKSLVRRPYVPSHPYMRSRRVVDENQERAYKLQAAGKKISELQTALAIKKAIKEGRSFAKFVQNFSPPNFKGNLNHGVIVFSPRIYKGSNFYILWKEQGGKFSYAEMLNLEKKPRGTPTFVSSWLNRKMVSNKSVRGMEESGLQLVPRKSPLFKHLERDYKNEFRLKYGPQTLKHEPVRYHPPTHRPISNENKKRLVVKSFNPVRVRVNSSPHRFPRYQTKSPPHRMPSPRVIHSNFNNTSTTQALKAIDATERIKETSLVSPSGVTTRHRSKILSTSRTLENAVSHLNDELADLGVIPKKKTAGVPIQSPVYRKKQNLKILTQGTLLNIYNYYQKTPDTHLKINKINKNIRSLLRLRPTRAIHSMIEGLRILKTKIQQQKAQNKKKSHYK